MQKKRRQVWASVSLIKQLKVLAAIEGRLMQDLLDDAMKEYLKKKGNEYVK